MVVQFMNNKSDERQIFKEVVGGSTMNGVLREESSIIRPSILCDSSAVLNYNFAYIPEWRRYYYVRNITSVRTGLWQVDMETDVLMSFKNDIAMYQVVVDKQSSEEIGNEYIDDGSLVADSRFETETISFTAGFDDNPHYVLIVAG